jgi:type I restriction enzyme S subunit
MKSYPDYKDSGFEFIGKIPTHWSLISLKYLLQDGNDGIKIGPFGSSLKLEIIKEDGYKVYGQGNVINDDFTWGHRYIDEDKFQELSVYEIHQNDIIITMMGTTGQAKVVPQNIKPGIFDSHIIRVRVNNKTFPQYVSMLINDSYYVYNQVKINSKGSIMEGLNSSIVKAIQIALPPTPEQQAIADFLDRKTAQIDALIEKKQRQIDLLQEQRTALINHAVTKGLNPDVRMKDSGVEWMGEIPSHWDVKRIKYLGKITGGYSFKSDAFEDFDTGCRVLKIANIQTMRIDWTDESFIDESYYQNLPDFRLYNGDLVFALTRPVISTGIKVAIIQSEEKILINQRNAVFRASDKQIVSWMYYVLFNSRFVDFFKSLIDATGQQPNISSIDIGNIPIPVPPVNEIKSIIKFLKEETNGIDEALASARRQIELIQEYRTTLISETVTGKIDVRTVV